MASNRVIGRDGKLPWHLPEDLRWFKKITLGHPILMGRKTFESLPGLLPRRRHIVLSRSLTAPPAGINVIASINDLPALGVSGDVYVIGGAQIYELLLPRCSELFLTYICDPYEGDTRFPDFEPSFELIDILDKTPTFELRHYRNTQP